MNRSTPFSRRSAKIRGAWLAFLGSGAILVALVILLTGNPLKWFTSEEKPTLFVYCGAGIKPPVAEAAAEYEKEYGVHVELQYGGSQTLLNAAEVSKRGDLYIPADSSYITLAREKHLVEEAIPLAVMTAVLAYPKGSSKKVDSLQEFLDSDQQVSNADPGAAAIGKLSKRELGSDWPAFEKHIKVNKTTVSDVANDILTGSVDAGIIWDAVAEQHPKLDFVRIPELAGANADITVGVLKSSENPTAALGFARYLAARDKGSPLFKKFGYRPTLGDKWAEKPEIVLYAGAMLRPAIEPTVEQFAKREGVTIKRVYKGCGILLSMMQTEGKPDVYYSCDASFMDRVSGEFPEKMTLSSNPMVLLTAKGKNVTELTDLLRPDVRVGLCDPEKSALGALSWTLLEKRLDSEQFKAIREKVKTQVPQADFLVTNIRAGALDAAIVYRSNAQVTLKQEPETFEVHDIPNALATQPVGIGKDSEYKQLMGRLMEKLRSEQSRRRFLDSGFDWKGASAKP